jgi:hypothetical protein
MENVFDQLIKYLPLLIPIAIIQLALMIFAIVDLLKRQRTKGPKWVWAVVIVFVNFIGPILYFVIGREEE